MEASNSYNTAILFSDSLYKIGKDALLQTPFMNKIPVFKFSDVAALENEVILNKFSSYYLISDDNQRPAYFQNPDLEVYFKEFEVKTGDFVPTGRADEFSNKLLVEQMICLLLELKVQSMAANEKRLSEKVSSYALAIESLYSVTSFQEKSEVINFMKYFFAMMCLPEHLSYFKSDSLDQGNVHLIDFTLEELTELHDSKPDYSISASGRSFCFKVEHGNENDGIFVVENVGNAGRLYECLNLALSVKKVVSLALVNISYKNDIVDAKNKLAESNELLKIINKILRHDLTNDFSAIKMSLEMYEMKQNKKYLDISKKAALNGLERISDMGTLEDLVDEGKTPELYSVKEIIEKLAPENMDISVSLTGNCKVRADNAISSVFDNLIKNAKSHGNAKNIKISVKPAGSYCRISVSDDGDGIPLEIIQQIFDEGFTSGSGGHSGLGLYIVKKTIERYGGKITVERNTQRGVTFKIDLPSS